MKAEPIRQPRSSVKRTPSVVRRVKGLSGRDNLNFLYQWQSAAGDDVSVGGLGGWTATTVAAATGGYVPPPPDSYWRDSVIVPVGPSRADAGYTGSTEEVRPAGHGRVGPGKLEADAAKAAAEAAWRASTRHPTVKEPVTQGGGNPWGVVAESQLRTAVDTRGPQSGAANTSIEAGLGDWVEGYTQRRFEEGDADGVLPEIPRRLRIFGMEVGDKKYTGGWDRSYPALHYDPHLGHKRVPRGTRPLKRKKYVGSKDYFGREWEEGESVISHWGWGAVAATRRFGEKLAGRVGSIGMTALTAGAIAHLTGHGTNNPLAAAVAGAIGSAVYGSEQSMIDSVEASMQRSLFDDDVSVGEFPAGDIHLERGGNAFAPQQFEVALGREKGSWFEHGFLL